MEVEILMKVWTCRLSLRCKQLCLSLGRIEVKRFELEKVLGFEKMLQIYEAFKREGKLSEVSEEINLMFKELVDLEEFFFNN